MTFENAAWLGLGIVVGYYFVAHYRKTGKFV